MVTAILLGSAAAVLGDPQYSAQFADNVLRPLIGDAGVISLEGFVFGVEDRFNHATKQAPAPAEYTVSVPVAIPTATALAAEAVPTLAAITPIVTPSLPGEGVWSQVLGTPMFTTFIRTDPTRPYSVVNLVYFPTQELSLGLVAGTKYPGGPPGSGKVPQTIQDSGTLLAAFNGGFQEKDGHYGMVVNGVTYVPLEVRQPTVFIYTDGHVTMSPYDGTMPTGAVAARQNGPYLVQNDQTSPITSHGVSLWAGTANGDYITWRSGIGVTVNGDVIYAVGNSLTPTALADALRLGGSQNAIQLDVNAFWVRCMFYQWNGSSYTWSTLTKDLTNGGKQYLDGYEKDFFYIYSKEM
jgi:hypothetical protein